MVMIFQSEKALRELLDSGMVYTFRLLYFNGDRKLGKDWITYKRGGKKIGDVIVSIAHHGPKNPNRIELEPYSRYSGFDSVEEWIDEIKQLNKPDPDIGFVGEVFCVHLVGSNDELVSKYINGELK